MFGQQIQARRQAMEMSLNVLSREMGGSPGPSFLSKLESGHVDASARVAARLADTLNLPPSVVLNAAGYATDDQQREAMARLADLVGSPSPVVMTLPVMDPDHPEDIGSGGRRQRMVRTREPRFLIDLKGKANEPFVGEVFVATEHEPEEGIGVVVEIAGRASAWTYHDPGKPTGPFIENGLGEKRTKGYKILGIITRVVSEMTFE